MPESSSERELYGAQWAGRICVALLVGLAMLTGVAFYDEHRLSGLETTEENSAVGDKVLFAIPQGALEQKSPGSILKFEGKDLFAVSLRECEARDSRMLRQGFDDSRTYSIYCSTEPLKSFKGEVEKAGETFYYLKTAPGKYLKLKR